MGEGGVGKTIYTLNRLNGSYDKRYVATIGVEVHSLSLSTMTKGGEVDRVVFSIWDCAGQEKFGGLLDGYFIMSDVGMFMFNDVCTLKNIPNRIRDYRRVIEQGPVVFVWSMWDPNNMELNLEMEAMIDVLLPDQEVVRINTKEGINLNEPFEKLLRQVTGDQDMRVL